MGIDTDELPSDNDETIGNASRRPRLDPAPVPAAEEMKGLIEIVSRRLESFQNSRPMLKLACALNEQGNYPVLEAKLSSTRKQVLNGISLAFSPEGVILDTPLYGPGVLGYSGHPEQERRATENRGMAESIGTQAVMALNAMATVRGEEAIQNTIQKNRHSSLTTLRLGD